MRLRSVGAQVMTIGDLGLTVSFDAGEESGLRSWRKTVRPVSEPS